MDEREAYGILGTLPHCDGRVLHPPKVCKFCDEHPDWQALRVLYRINFTGEEDPGKTPCPSLRDRPLETVHAWPGNQPAGDI